MQIRNYHEYYTGTSVLTYQALRGSHDLLCTVHNFQQTCLHVTEHEYCLFFVQSSKCSHDERIIGTLAFQVQDLDRWCSKGRLQNEDDLGCSQSTFPQRYWSSTFTFTALGTVPGTQTIEQMVKNLQPVWLQQCRTVTNRQINQRRSIISDQLKSVSVWLWNSERLE